MEDCLFFITQKLEIGFALAGGRIGCIEGRIMIPEGLIMTMMKLLQACLAGKWGNWSEKSKCWKI